MLRSIIRETHRPPWFSLIDAPAQRAYTLHTDRAISDSPVTGMGRTDERLGCRRGVAARSWNRRLGTLGRNVILPEQAYLIPRQPARCAAGQFDRELVSTAQSTVSTVRTLSLLPRLVSLVSPLSPLRTTATQRTTALRATVASSRTESGAESRTESRTEGQELVDPRDNAKLASHRWKQRRFLALIAWRRLSAAQRGRIAVGGRHCKTTLGTGTITTEGRQFLSVRPRLTLWVR